MVKQRFEDFWTADKSITEDIFFHPSKGHTDIFVFDEIGFSGEYCDEIYVTGDYNCRTGSMAFNFQLKGAGAVRRFCINGQVHGDSGRFHEHIIQKDSDVGPANLPHAVTRSDLEDLTAKLVWFKICEEAKIAHTGQFSNPEEWCK
jgi:hypothetical protein